MIAQARQRKAELDVEHDIDSHPLEPQLSATAVELMRSEEAASRAGNDARRRQLTARADQQIGSECKAALNYIVDLHSKQRKEVWTKHAAERAKLRRSIAKHAGKHGFDDIFASADARRELPRVGDIATEDDARRQAIREASAKWLKAEKFGLLTAFRQQVQRVQTEWSDHVGQLCSEYTETFRDATGSPPPAEDFCGIAVSKPGAGERNWLSKAKQESLIHTAPVLAPDMSASGFRGSASTDSASGAAVRSQFKAAVAAVIRQQEEAVRWIVRQCRRMQAQAEAQERERLSVARHTDSFDVEWDSLRRAVQTAQDAVDAAAARAAAHLHAARTSPSPGSQGRRSPTDADLSHLRGPRFVGDQPRPSGQVASSAPAFVHLASGSDGMEMPQGDAAASGAGDEVFRKTTSAGTPPSSRPLADLASESFPRSSSAVTDSPGRTRADASGSLRAIPERSAAVGAAGISSSSGAGGDAPVSRYYGHYASTGAQAGADTASLRTGYSGSSRSLLSSRTTGTAFGSAGGSSKLTASQRKRATSYGNSAHARSAASSPAGSTLYSSAVPSAARGYGSASPGRARGGSTSPGQAPGAARRSPTSRETPPGSGPRRLSPAALGSSPSPSSADGSTGRSLYRVGSTGSGASLRRSGQLGLTSVASRT